MRNLLLLALFAVAMALSLASCGDGGTKTGTSVIPGERPLGTWTPGTSPATAP